MENTRIPSVEQIVKEGYGDAMAMTLINVVNDVMDSVHANGAVTGEDCRNVRNLLWLYKALMKDLHGIDHGVY